MAKPRDVRRLALLALYQIDARGGETDVEDVIASLESCENLIDEVDGQRFLDEPVQFTKRDRTRALDTAVGAWRNRETADRDLAAIAPAWPPGRQAPMDRAILRLAHYELTQTPSPPRAAINEAVELAKTFSTSRSPAFINGVLSKVTPADAPASAE
jgi:N utilization substance protein B